METGALLYHEPDSENVVIHASSILLLNNIEYCLDRVVYCGLVGQILLGVAWGIPGAQLLSPNTETVITNLGYLGLILLVFEGGLSTNLNAFGSNVFLSVLMALTGISIPIASSFLMIKLCEASILQAFAAGCALSSTSLETTFTILKSSGLTSSRLGTVLTSAAMLDDVVDLVLVQVIANIGTSEAGSFSAGIIVRPVFVSVAFAILIPAFCWISRAMLIRLALSSKQHEKVGQILTSDGIFFFVHTLILFGIAIGGAYAGTSILFAAYLAGAAISSFDEPNARSSVDEKLPTPESSLLNGGPVNFSQSTHPAEPMNSQDCNDNEIQVVPTPRSLNETIKTVRTPVDIICNDRKQGKQPSESIRISKHASELGLKQVDNIAKSTGLEIYEMYYMAAVNKILKPFVFASIGFSVLVSRLFDRQVLWRGLVHAVLMLFGKLVCGTWLMRITKRSAPESEVKGWKLFQYQAQSPYPAAILGSAMVSRGEIGFLIAAIAQSNDIFKPSSGQVDLYLIVTWAILVCTIIGPVTVGLLAKHVTRLQRAAQNKASGTQDPLGMWAKF